MTLFFGNTTFRSNLRHRFDVLAKGCLVAVAVAFSGEVLRADFENDPTGPYSRAMCQLAFPGVTWDNGLTGESRVSVVAGGDTAGGGKAIRVLYPLNSLGPGGTGGNPAGGAQWKSMFGGEADTLYARYRLFFPVGFGWTRGGKLPGLCGSQCNTGGNPPTGRDGWSARLMWRSGASLVQYVYSAGQAGTYGTDLVWKKNGEPLVVETGKWHEVQVRICLNTPGTDGGQGKYDGRVTGWYDGELAIDTIGFRFRDLDTMHIDQFYFSTFFGGSTNDFRPTKDERIFFDDFAVSDAFIASSSASLAGRGQGWGLRSTRGRSLEMLSVPDGETAVFQDMAGRELATVPVSGGRVEVPLGVHGLATVTISGRSGGARLFLP